MELVLIISIALLLAYIIYLHTRLVKKDIRIDSLESRISEIEGSLKTGEVSDEKLFDSSVLGFLFEDEPGCKVFIHYTKEENDAQSITSEGFRFSESFYRTALAVTSDRLDLLVKHLDKKYFGDFIVVICISANTVSRITAVINAENIKNTSVENILSSREKCTRENIEFDYRLPAQYIKGYVNHSTGAIYKNPGFDPGYYSEFSDKNLQAARAK